MDQKKVSKNIKEVRSAEPEAKRKPQTGKRSRGKPIPKQKRGMMFRKGDKKKAKIQTSSSDDWSSNTSKIIAPSPKRKDIKWTPPQPTQIQKTPTEATKNPHGPDRQL